MKKGIISAVMLVAFFVLNSNVFSAGPPPELWVSLNVGSPVGEITSGTVCVAVFDFVAKEKDINISRIDIKIEGDTNILRDVGIYNRENLANALNQVPSVSQNGLISYQVNWVIPADIVKSLVVKMSIVGGSYRGAFTVSLTGVESNAEVNGLPVRGNPLHGLPPICPNQCAQGQICQDGKCITLPPPPPPDCATIQQQLADLKAQLAQNPNSDELKAQIGAMEDALSRLGCGASETTFEITGGAFYQGQAIQIIKRGNEAVLSFKLQLQFKINNGSGFTIPKATPTKDIAVSSVGLTMDSKWDTNSKILTIVGAAQNILWHDEPFVDISLGNFTGSIGISFQTTEINGGPNEVVYGGKFVTGKGAVIVITALRITVNPQLEAGESDSYPIMVGLNYNFNVVGGKPPYSWTISPVQSENGQKNYDWGNLMPFSLLPSNHETLVFNQNFYNWVSVAPTWRVYVALEVMDSEGKRGAIIFYACLLPGDVSMDGKVTSEDAVMLLASIVDRITLSPPQKFAGDTSRNGSITSLDATLILRAVAGIQPLLWPFGMGAPAKNLPTFDSILKELQQALKDGNKNISSSNLEALRNTKKIEDERQKAKLPTTWGKIKS